MKLLFFRHILSEKRNVAVTSALATISGVLLGELIAPHNYESIFYFDSSIPVGTKITFTGKGLVTYLTAFIINEYVNNTKDIIFCNVSIVENTEQIKGEDFDKIKR